MKTTVKCSFDCSEFLVSNIEVYKSPRQMPYNMRDSEGSAGQFSLVLHIIFCGKQPFCEVYSKIRLDLSLIFPAS